MMKSDNFEDERENFSGHLAKAVHNATGLEEQQGLTVPTSLSQQLKKSHNEMEIVEITPLATDSKSGLRPLEKALIILTVLSVMIALSVIIAYATYNDGICKTPTCINAASRIISNMDTTVEPCKNFYQYACGGWLKKNVIPEDSVRHSTIDILSEQRDITLKGILEKRNDSDISAVKKTKIFYESCMDEGTKNSRKGQPLIATLPDIFDWPVAVENWERIYGVWSAEESMSHLNAKYAVGSIINVFVEKDFQNNTVHVIYIDQPHSGLLSPDFYECSEFNEKVCSAYEGYMFYLVSLVRKERNLTIKYDQNREDIKRVFELEKAIANALVSSEIRRDPNSIYMKMTVSQIETDYPVILDGKRLNWLSFINGAIKPGGISIKEDEEVVMFASDYIKKITNLANTFNARDFQNYLAWQYVKSVVEYLSWDYKNAAKLFNQLLVSSLGKQSAVQCKVSDLWYGSNTEPANWKICNEVLLQYFADVLGRLYVEEAFSADSKEVVRGMITDIRQVFLEMLEDQEWMDEETKLKATFKASNIVEKIGFSDDLFDDEKLNKIYAGVSYKSECSDVLKLKDDEYFENNLNYKEYAQILQMKRLRELTSPEEWTSGAAEINAEYVMDSNQIVFPAAILQPPFFHPLEPKALSYGGIGTVIGHEFTHGFDDTGKDRDENGNLINWWTEESFNKFNELSKCFVHQYGNYSWSSAGGELLSGTGTLSENIADNGGLREAYKAYEKFLKKKGKEDILPGLDLTDKQLFFLGFSQIWCSAYTPDYALTSITEHEHSPGEFRVIGTLQNFPEFSEAFSCRSNDYMNPEHKCRLW
ncbi:neprilysin [Pelodytes ibericus]